MNNDDDAMAEEPDHRGSVEPESDRRIVTALAAIAIVLSLIGIIRWFADHPHPIYWDEANYLGMAAADARALRTEGLTGAIKSLLFLDPLRPPAYRALGLVVTAFGGVDLALVRGFSLAVSVFAFCLLTWTVARVCRARDALLATAIVVSMPAVLMAGGWFGTEYPLFLAVALLIASLAETTRPLLLATAVASGLLAKTSFLLLGFPSIAAALLASARNRRELLRIAAGTAAGILVAAGWWTWHFRDALAFAEYSRMFPRASFGPALSFQTVTTKIEILLSSIGWGAALTIVLLSVVALPRLKDMAVAERRLVVIGSLILVPVVVTSLASPAFLVRILVPAFPGLILLFAVLLGKAPSRMRLAISLVAVIQPAVFAVSPATVLPRVEQTDWSQLRVQIPVAEPRISVMGGWPSASPPEIAWAWKKTGDRATVRWLWRFEDGEIAWDRIMSDAMESDVVLVISPAQRYRSDRRLQHDPDLDNRHSDEFRKRLGTLQRFQAAEPIMAGRGQRTQVLVFRRNS